MLIRVIKKIVVYIYIGLKNIFHLSFFISTVLLFVTYYSAYLHPNSFILLPLLSLLFPVFLFLNILWILFFAFSFHLKRLIVAVLIQLFFLNDIQNFYAINWKEKPQHSENTLSVLSFNVKLFDLYNWQNNHLTRQKIMEYLKNNPADIMCFQEFYTSEDSNDFNNLQELKKLFPNYYFHSEYFVTLRQNDHWGLLTISRYPIIKTTVIEFNNAKNNGCIISTIAYQKDTIQVINLHLQSYSLFKKKKWRPHQKPDDENFFEALDSTAKGKNLIDKIYQNNNLKTQQAESILRIVKENPYPTLIVGDFNDIAHSYLMRQLKKQHLKDVFAEKGNGFGFTYHDKIYLRIDYIFHSEHFKVLDFITENNKDTKHLSDHYPIRCLLELKK